MVDEETVPWIKSKGAGVKTLRGREAEGKNAAKTKKKFTRLIKRRRAA
jgi:hypothetical protein